MCMDEDANLYFPESIEENEWIKHMIGSDKMYLGFKGYDETNGFIINMDNSLNAGIRFLTRKQS